MTIRREKGQALVEMALTLPILLVLLVGAYATTRTAFLNSRAESAAFTEALRVGRNLPGIEEDLSRSVSHEEKTVAIRHGQKKNSRLLPPPFPLMDGKTSSAAEVNKSWMEIGEPEWLPPARISRRENFHVNCWGKDSSSGKSMKRYIRGVVMLGAFR